MNLKYNVDHRPSSRASSRGPEDQNRDRPHSRGGYDDYYDYRHGDYRRSYSLDDYYRQQYDDRYRGKIRLLTYSVYDLFFLTVDDVYQFCIGNINCLNGLVQVMCIALEFLFFKEPTSLSIDHYSRFFSCH